MVISSIDAHFGSSICICLSGPSTLSQLIARNDCQRQILGQEAVDSLAYIIAGGDILT